MATEAGSKKSDNSFTWTDNEVELLLEVIKIYKSNKESEGIDWESVRSKYEKILELFHENYPKDADEEDFPRVKKLEQMNKARITSKIKTMRSNYKKAVDLGRRSGGGRVVMTFYDLCHDVWGGSPATESIRGGFETSSNLQSALNESDTSNNSFVVDESTDVALNTVADDEQLSSGSSTSTNKNIDRRKKIAQFLKNDRDKRMSKKQSIETQHLNIAREELDLKRKLIEKLDSSDAEFHDNMNKMAKCLETVSSALTQSFNVMHSLLQQNVTGVAAESHQVREEDANGYIERVFGIQSNSTAEEELRFLH